MSVEFKLNTTAETQQVNMSRNDIIEALHVDPEYFIQFYLAEELKYAVPEFHKECFNLITAQMVMYIALALPRGHAKTTLSKLACVWYFLFTDIRFIVYVSNTAPIAAEACKDIIEYLRGHNHQSVFEGPYEVDFEVDREGHGYYKFWMTVPDGKGNFYKKFCILKALGAGQQVRGLNVDNERPQLAVVDDLEDNENTATPALQRKLKKWFFGAFFKALSRKNKKIIYLGNMLSNQSILYYLCEKSQLWHSVRKGALLSNNEPLWSDMWPLEDIRADFVEYQNLGEVALWFAEMMNMPMAEGTALIQPEEIVYLPAIIPWQHKYAFITYDPAISQKTWANSSAIVVHAQIADRWQVAEQMLGKFTPEQVFYILLELCQRWQTRVVGIEQGSYQLGLKPLFDILMKVHNQAFETFEIPHKNRSKVERLTVWCGFLRKKLWCLTEGDHVITQQLITFDPLKTNNVDDLIDACAMGPVMTELYMGEIIDQYTVSDERYRTTVVLPN